MKLIKISLVVFFLGVMVSLGVCADITPGNNSATVIASALATEIPNADLVAFVDNAVAYAKANGKEKANGVDFFKNMASVAKMGKGFVYYVFVNPASYKKPELKLTYVERVDDAWWLGSGTYLSNMSANLTQASRENLTGFVEDAAKYAKDNGKDKALSAFNDKNGTFFKGGLYVFAYDFAGNTLAAPTQPDLVGKNRIDVKDPNGVLVIRDMAELAKGWSGFTYYVYGDPAKNMMQRLKLSYAMNVDDNWWLGAGLYAQ